MKNLYFKYLLMGLWLICYIPFKKALVLSSQSTAVATATHNQESAILETTSDHFFPESITPSLIKAAYQHKLHLAQYSDSPMIYLDSWNPQILDLQESSSSWVRKSYLNATYLLRLSGHKNQQFPLQMFSPS